MKALTWVHENMSGEILDTIMKFITYSGDYAAVWIILSAVLLIRRPTREIGIVMFFAVLIGFVLNDLMIKPLIERPRPFIDNPSLSLIISPPGGYSFASGHTVKAFAAAFVICIYNRKYGTVFFGIRYVDGVLKGVSDDTLSFGRYYGSNDWNIMCCCCLLCNEIL